MAIVVERAFTSRSTLQRVEAGDTSVGIGIYAAVLQALGLLDGLGLIADIAHDSAGQALSSAELPKRIHLKRSMVRSKMPDFEVHIDLHGQTRLMQRAERRRAEREGNAVQTLPESAYLLGVSDETRLGALRFRLAGESDFQAPIGAGVPALVDLGNLLHITERILRDEETDDDLRLIFAPGSSLGGARPKASVIDQHGHLSLAKFPKEADEYSIETWEEIAMRLAERAGIATPHHELIKVAGKPVLLSRRFDRAGF